MGMDEGGGSTAPGWLRQMYPEYQKYDEAGGLGQYDPAQWELLSFDQNAFADLGDRMRDPLAAPFLASLEDSLRSQRYGASGNLDPNGAFIGLSPDAFKEDWGSKLGELVMPALLAGFGGLALSGAGIGAGGAAAGGSGLAAEAAMFGSGWGGTVASGGLGALGAGGTAAGASAAELASAHGVADVVAQLGPAAEVAGGGVTAGASFAGDPIGKLIQGLNVGLSPDAAIAAVEAASPGATQSFLEFLVNNPSQLLSLGGTLPTGGGTVAEQLKKALGLGTGPISTGLNVASGLYGLYKANELEDLAKQASEQQDPFGPYRKQYAEKLSGLMADPSTIFNMPEYEAGEMALRRRLAKEGQLLGGAEKIALQKYGGDFFNQETARLAQLAGANFSPTGGNVLIQGQRSANDLASASLASLGYAAGGV